MMEKRKKKKEEKMDSRATIKIPITPRTNPISWNHV
jgi:hypothetical protein